MRCLNVVESLSPYGNTMCIHSLYLLGIPVLEDTLLKWYCCQCCVEVGDSTCGVADRGDSSHYPDSEGAMWILSRAVGTVDLLFTLAGLLSGSWEFAYPV